MHTFAAQEDLSIIMLAIHLLCSIIYLPVDFQYRAGLLRGVVTFCVFGEGLLFPAFFLSAESACTWVVAGINSSCAARY